MICKSSGDTIIAEFKIQGSTAPVTFNAMDIVNDRGIIQNAQLQAVTVVGDDSYIGIFMAPAEEFKIQVTGTDDNGLQFSYISDISIEPTTISLRITGKHKYDHYNFMKYKRRESVQRSLSMACTNTLRKAITQLLLALKVLNKFEVI